MRILLFDPFHGAAGDMIVGSLIDLGADRSIVEKVMDSIVAKPVITYVKRKGIHAVHVNTCAHVERRDLKEVLERISSSDAPALVKEMAKRIFFRLHSAEKKVHGTSNHFHEVGADDAISEILGACAALHNLAIDGVIVQPILVGKGYIETMHGKIPIPAPATVEIFKNSKLEIIAGIGEGELCTPTGAAILAEFQSFGIDSISSSRIIAVGYGAGTNETEDMPNVLRTLLLETDTAHYYDEVDVIETNVDDVSGEVIAYVIDRLMGEGALDTSIIPLSMKKGRPGHLIRVICEPPLTTRIIDILIEELGTLGIRCLESVHRFIASRTIEKVSSSIKGQVRMVGVKCSWKNGNLVSLKAEFEQCRALAVELDIPLKEVIRTVEETAWKEIPYRKGQGDKYGSTEHRE